MPRGLRHRAFCPTKPQTVYTLRYPNGCLLAAGPTNGLPPPAKPGVIRLNYLVSVAVVVAGVLVVRWYNLDNCRRRRPHHREATT